MEKYYSLHKIDDEDNFSFDPVQYSKFKFGDGFIAHQYGHELALGFIDNLLKIKPITEQIVVISSPYSFIPTATFALKDAFVFTLNHWLINRNMLPVQEIKIHRTITYKEDYGELDANERLALIGNDKFHIDRSFLTGKTLIFIDDIKITGSHEKVIKKLIYENELSNNVCFLYFAELINPKIHPKIENTLNYFFVKSLKDVDSIIKSDKFAINTRLVKYVLNSDETEFIAFEKRHSDSILTLFYNMAVGNSYHHIDSYKHNFDILQKRYESSHKESVDYQK